jgi:hypothetical protein
MGGTSQHAHHLVPKTFFDHGPSWAKAIAHYLPCAPLPHPLWSGRGAGRLFVTSIPGSVMVENESTPTSILAHRSLRATPLFGSEHAAISLGEDSD